MATADKDTGKISFTIAQVLASTYGPYAFGLITFVTVWFISISPQLEAMRIDFRSQQQLMVELNALNHNQAAVARTMQFTAEALERTVTKLIEHEEGR